MFELCSVPSIEFLVFFLPLPLCLPPTLSSFLPSSLPPSSPSTYRLSEQALSWNKNTRSVDVACPAETGGSTEGTTFFIHVRATPDYTVL